jgi:hypothetical protein
MYWFNAKMEISVVIIYCNAIVDYVIGLKMTKVRSKHVAVIKNI